MTGRHGKRGQAGFSIIEALVAMLVALILLGAAFELFIDDAKIYHAQSQIAEMRQNARSSMEFIARDIVQTGYGLKFARPEVPVVVANQPGNLGAFADTAITFLTNRNDIATDLTADMASTSDALTVATVAGFAAGQRVLVWDKTGSWEWMTISSITGSTLVHATPLGKAYLADDQTRVGTVDEIGYRFDAASLRLERIENAGSWLTVAENVELVKFRYFDKTNTEIFPATNAGRRAIRRVGLELRVRTAEQDRTRNPPVFRTYTVQSDLTPRNLEALPAT